LDLAEELVWEHRITAAKLRHIDRWVPHKVLLENI